MTEYIHIQVDIRLCKSCICFGADVIHLVVEAYSIMCIPKADQHKPNATTYLLGVTPSNLLLCGKCRMNISKLQIRLALFPALPVFIVIEVKCTNGSGLGMRLWYTSVIIVSHGHTSFCKQGVATLD